MKTILSYAGNTEQIDKLRQEIFIALQNNQKVQVKLCQPGIMYKKNNVYHTVIDFMNEWTGKNVSFMSNLVPIQKCNVDFEYSNDMFFAGHKLYLQNTLCKGLLAKCVTHSKKTVSKHWDLLLGEKSDNKDWIYKNIQKYPIEAKTFLTYYGNDSSKGSWSASVKHPEKHSAETIGDKEHAQVRCSDLIDPNIYNQTFYTAMIETTIHNDFAMFSEKEAKPIIAKRPFVIFGSAGHLKALRSLGYKTFDPVIDESYDQILDKHTRWTKVFESMRDLSLKDPTRVYSNLRTVLEHNKKHFENTNWKKAFKHSQDYV